MAVVYIKEQGAYIKKSSQKIQVEKKGKVLIDFPIHTITNLAIFGNIQLTTQALQMLVQNGVDVTFFTYSGHYMGRVAAESSKNIFLRLSQYKIYDNQILRLSFAKAIVENKIKNQIAVIENHNWKDSQYEYHKDISELRITIKKLPNAKNTNEVMGIEGSCSAIYFSCFAHMFHCNISFDKRTRRPPKDPINVILSLAYSLLTKEIASILEAESFETYLGFLHGIRYGRKSLALDIVEEFRQPVVDRLVVNLFNKRIMNELDFEQEEERVMLTEGGFKKFCGEYEKWMKMSVGSYESRSFRNIMQEQAGRLKRSIKEGMIYVPYEWREKSVPDKL